MHDSEGLVSYRFKPFWFAQVLYLGTSRVQVLVGRKPRCDVMEIMFLIIGSLPISSYFGFSDILENGFSKKLLVHLVHLGRGSSMNKLSEVRLFQDVQRCMGICPAAIATKSPGTGLVLSWKVERWCHTLMGLFQSADTFWSVNLCSKLATNY